LDPNQIKTYTRAARRKLMAGSAMRKLTDALRAAPIDTLVHE
jgi:hypothetical protein